MAKSNNFIFIVLHVIAWIIFVGLCIEAGGLLVNFFFSLYNPSFVDNLYQKLDLSDLYNRNQWIFYSMYSFILFIALLKAFLFYEVIRLLNKLDMTKPFNDFVSAQITKISYYTLSIGILSYMARESTRQVQHYGYDIHKLNEFWSDAQAFILMSAVVYVIAAIFRKGVEIQNENDLTV